MIVSQSANVVQSSFTDLWYIVVQYLPAILAAIIVFVIGWIVAIILYRIVVQVVKILRIDDALKAAGVESATKDAGFRLDVGRFLGTLIKWFVVIVFLVAALDVLGLSRVTLFLQEVVLLYLPNVIAAVLILILAAIVAEAVRNVIAGSARVVSAHAANLAGVVAKYAIWVTAVLAALSQLNVAAEFVQSLFIGLVAALALAFGLSFGLGGKEAAARTIERVRSEMANHRA
ncbi:MAG: Small-conductance mechanosensitive ion channel-like protein [Parcubacteria group bacterium GW2011_GWA2_51_10]|nr:MAG: Small-conductance mechanosensitive ion channel-like protein [Parcubacteria group bacterium GW2011_GWA2_51_10]